MPKVKEMAKPLETAMPEHLAPMLAILSDLPAKESEWGFEYKWDGVRAVCYWDSTRIRLESRNLIDITARYPELEELAKRLGARKAILDGEIVALDKMGHPSFPLLQRRMHLQAGRVDKVAQEVPAHYFIFDILFLDDRSLMLLPYRDRREVLDGLSLEAGNIRVPPSYRANGEAMVKAATEHALEGVMAKRLDSIYQPGRRSPLWRKIKVINSAEFVIGGWIPEQNNPHHIGSLLLGYYEEGSNGLTYAGNVGTGFTEQTHAMLLKELRRLEKNASPFHDMAKRNIHYISPQLVAEIHYRRWPEGAHVQQASFKGLRMDKPPTDVTHERKVV